MRWHREALRANLTLRGSLVTAATAFADAEADSSMGADLGMDIAFQANQSSTEPAASGGGDSGPATLEHLHGF